MPDKEKWLTTFAALLLALTLGGYLLVSNNVDQGNAIGNLQAEVASLQESAERKIDALNDGQADLEAIVQEGLGNTRQSAKEPEPEFGMGGGVGTVESICDSQGVGEFDLAKMLLMPQPRAMEFDDPDGLLSLCLSGMLIDEMIVMISENPGLFDSSFGDHRFDYGYPGDIFGPTDGYPFDYGYPEEFFGPTDSYQFDEKSYELGYTDGYEFGYTDGYDYGYTDGYDYGYTDGCASSVAGPFGCDEEYPEEYPYCSDDGARIDCVAPPPTPKPPPNDPAG